MDTPDTTVINVSDLCEEFEISPMTEEHWANAAEMDLGYPLGLALLALRRWSERMGVGTSGIARELASVAADWSHGTITLDWTRVEA